MYQSDRFLEFAREFLGEEIKQEIINEIRELRRMDEVNNLKFITKKKRYQKEYLNREQIYKDGINLRNELKYISEQKDFLENAKRREIHKLETQDPSASDYSKYENIRM